MAPANLHARNAFLTDVSDFAPPADIPSLADPAPGKVRFDCDLHLHGRYSMGVSKNMTFPVLAEQAARKGIHLVGTSDITHPKWRAHFLDSVKAGELAGTAAQRAGTSKGLQAGAGRYHESGAGRYHEAGAAADLGREKTDERTPLTGMDNSTCDVGLVAPGTYRLGPTRFILTAEVEDMRRVHHVLLFPELSAVESFYERMSPHSSTIDRDGRPKLRLPAEEVGQAAHDVEALFGPAHAFTPWTAMYAYHDSLADCYGDMARRVSFLELGLSAQTSYADSIPELRHLTFITSSDAHSPWPNKFAREFNRLESSEMTFAGVKEALHRENGSRVILNVGLPPQEGKYNRTGCTRCYQRHTYPEAVVRNMRCKCGGLIKRGVVDRVWELAHLAEEVAEYSAGVAGGPWPVLSPAAPRAPPHPPDHRPPYLYLIPLGELIAKALGVASVNSKQVQREWELLVGRYGSEIAVSVDAPLKEVLQLAQPRVGAALEAFREGTYRIRPGCGGRYGELILPSSNIKGAKRRADPTVREAASRSNSDSGSESGSGSGPQQDEGYAGRQATLSQFG